MKRRKKGCYSEASLLFLKFFKYSEKMNQNGISEANISCPS
jgi:hypothetical protein